MNRGNGFKAFNWNSFLFACVVAIVMPGNSGLSTAQEAKSSVQERDPFDSDFSPELSGVMSAVSADSYEEALSMLAKLQARVRSGRDRSLGDEIQETKKRIMRLQRAFKRVEDSADQLRRNPEDPAANEELGLFYCVEKGDWQKGLELLSKSERPLLRDAATRDLKRPTTPIEQAAVADAWLKAVAQERDRETRQRFQLRGRYWYREARPRLTQDLRVEFDQELAAVPLFADRIVIWNQHNGEAADRGTELCVVTLLLGGKSVWRKNVQLPWKRDAPASVVLRPPRTKVDAIRVDVAKYRGVGGGLGEIEVYDGSVNIAENCSATADQYWEQNGRYHPQNVTDGDKSGDSGIWLLENGQTGWVSVDFVK